MRHSWHGAKKAIAVKSPFPFFGGKATVAGIVWKAIGDIVNYIDNI